LHNKDHHDWYTSGDQSKKDEMGRACGTQGGEEKCIQSFDGETLSKQTTWKTCTWEDNTKMDLKSIGWEGMEWINLAKNVDKWRAIVNVVMNFQVP
jgi:hypothetical protein